MVMTIILVLLLAAVTVLGTQVKDFYELLNMVMPEIGGVLIKGEKGTAKSTAVRALQQVMPPRRARLCPYRCDPDKPEMVRFPEFGSNFHTRRLLIV